MLITKFRSSLCQMAACLLLSGGLSTATQASLVNVSALPASVAVGGTVSVFFDISGLGAQALSLYSFQVRYDTAVLGFGGYSFDDPVSLRNELDLPEATSFSFAGSVTALSGGIVDVFGLSGNSPSVLNTSQADAFRFLTLTFNALGVSPDSAVTLDVGSSQFGDALAATLDVNFQNSRADIEVTPGGAVPEPGALSLAVLALVGAGAATRRRSRLLVSGAAGVLLVSGAATAQTVQMTQQRLPPVAIGATAVDAVVVKAQGMRLQLRTADGREFWVTTKANVGADAVGRRLTGQASARGDTLLIANPVYSQAP